MGTDVVYIHATGVPSGIDAGLIYRSYCVHTSEVDPNVRKSKISAFIKIQTSVFNSVIDLRGYKIPVTKL